MKIIPFITGLLLCSSLLFAQSAALKITKDSVKVAGELQVGNATKAVSGFLYNVKNGAVSFVKLGTDIQFQVGSANFPKAGDSVYASTLLINQTIKAWRNGLFQYLDSANGILYTPASGKVVFHPAFAASDRIYIEALQAMNFVTDSVFGHAPTGGGGNAAAGLQPIHPGVWDNGNNTYTLRWTTSNATLTASPRVLGLGSSTLAGNGATSPGRLGDLIQSFLNTNTTTPTWINLAVAGYATPNILPTAQGGNAGNNIDSALRANPDLIFVSLPSNDVVNGLTNAQILANFRTIEALAWARGIPVFWETSQPRTSATAAQQTQLKVLADSIRKGWPDRYVEGFAKVVDSAASTDAKILAIYDSGDGIHMLNPGVKFIGDSLAARLLKYFSAVTTVSNYTIDTSRDQSTWNTMETITNPNTVKKTYTRVGTSALYFRVKALYTDGTSSAYATAALPASGAGTGTQTPPGTSNTPTTDHRLLLDIGGDGVSTRDGSNIVSGKLTASPDIFNHIWNNMSGNASGAGITTGTSISDMRSVNNENTGMSITFIGAADSLFGTTATHALNFAGFTVNAGDYPKEAVQDNMYFSAAGVNVQNGGAGIIMRIKGLSKTNVYSFKLWGNRMDDANTGARNLEAKLGTDAWTASKTYNARYASSETPDFNRAIVFSGLTGVDSLDIDLRVLSGSSFGHISVVDIGIGGHLVNRSSIIIHDTTASVLAATGKASVDLNPSVSIPSGVTVSSAAWTMVSGPSTPTFGSASSAHCLMSNLTVGDYLLKLVLTMSNGDQLTPVIKVSVFPAVETRKVLRLHFSRTTQYIPGWVNVFGDPAVSHITKTDTTTNWSVDNVGPTTGSVINWQQNSGIASSDTVGTSTGNNSGVVPDIALDGLWFNYAIRDTAGRKNLIVAGLNSAKTYSLQFVGSRSPTATAPRYACYFVNDGAEQRVNALNNTLNSVSLTGIHPNASGAINIGVYTPTDQSTYGAFSYLNALIVIEEN